MSDRMSMEFSGDHLRHMELIAIVLDREATLRHCNEYLLRLTGWRAHEVMDRSFFDVFVPRDEVECPPVFGDLLDSLPPACQHENLIVTRAGEHRSIRWSNAVIRNAVGHAIGAACIGEDITERRSLERALLDESAQEQLRLAVELHEGLAQQLFGVSLFASSLATAAERGAMPKAQDLAQLADMAGSSFDACRKLAMDLSPLASIHGGLVGALRELATAAAPATGTPEVRFELAEAAPLRLTLEAATHLYHIADEALANALAHARASTIVVHLNIQRPLVRLVVWDDGVGVDIARAGGVGLKTMRYRAELLKAPFAVAPREPHGTRVVCEVRQ